MVALGGMAVSYERDMCTMGSEEETPQGWMLRAEIKLGYRVYMVQRKIGYMYHEYSIGCMCSICTVDRVHIAWVHYRVYMVQYHGFSGRNPAE